MDRSARRLTRPLVPLALLAVAAPLAAQDAPAKRAEGRYFIELAEIMVQPHDFDLAMGTVTPTGPRAGEPVEEEVADLSKPKAGAPRVTIGLNRTSGKTSIEFWIHDFGAKDERLPLNFSAEDQVVTSTLLPPGVVFQRQHAQYPDRFPAGTNFAPNYGNELLYVRRIDYRSGGGNLVHNIKENERTRLRWLAGIKYAELSRQVSTALTFTPEPITSRFDTQDFFFVQAAAETHGMGPNLGLDGRFILDKKRKKWSIEGRGEIALIPESTTASYAVSMVDNSAELAIEEEVENGVVVGLRITNVSEAPILPGIGSPTVNEPFNTRVTQQDFTGNTWVMEGRIGVRWQPSRFFTLGLDAWMLRWTDLITDVGIVDTVHREGRYEVIQGLPTQGDPQLRDDENVLHVPRFAARDDASFDGVSLNLKFDF